VAGLDKVNEFSLGDTLADGVPYDLNRDGPMRGGSYLFTRWLYDRAGGDLAMMDGTVASKGGPAFIRTLFDDPGTVASVLPMYSHGAIEDLAMDFYTTLAMSNREAVGDAKAVNGCFRYLPTVTDPVTMRQRGADLYAMFHGMMMNGPALQAIDAIDKELLAGGVEYVAIDAKAGQPDVTIAITADPTLMPRLRIGRIH
jgi:hypothetical protein